ncbi:mechanosensitive ion channel domain-containing protein [uncultured Pseudomonas sp.]|uniref:mechanosensitive ion channel family protein n=1 Tax=uncultured Pseudomonas sp. TaxID=114707 RepID=UPI00260655F5|nr:mechanosensitive ion channel domain-containing protein [uncultured Pseudomonas sp.]
MAAVHENQQKTAQLIYDLQDISFTKIGLILFGTWLVVLIARRLLPYLAERGPSQLRLYLLGGVPIIRMLMLVVAILWVIPIVFNITFQNFLVISGALGVAVGFAFKDYVSSLIAGMVAIFERPYRPGDWVEIDGDYGEVRTVGMRAIEICTADDNVIHVPHDKIWKSNISNANDGSHTLMCVTSFYVAPDHDPAMVRAVLRDVAMTSAYLEYDKPVLVMLSQTPLATHYQLKAYPFDLRDQFEFVSDLTIRGKHALADAGVTEVQAISSLTG